MFLGGRDDHYNNEDAIQLYQNSGWTTLTHMYVPRHDHAASIVNFDNVCKTNRKAWSNKEVNLYVLKVLWLRPEQSCVLT